MSLLRLSQTGCRTECIIFCWMSESLHGVLGLQVLRLSVHLMNKLQHQQSQASLVFVLHFPSLSDITYYVICKASKAKHYVDVIIPFSYLLESICTVQFS